MLNRIKIKKSKLVDIVIWNSYNEKYIINFFPNSIKYEVLEISKNRIDLVLNFSFIFYLIKFKYKNSFNTALTISLIKVFDPKKIITYNSTTPYNEKVLRYFDKIQFYNIQYCLEAPSHSLKMYQNYLAWGNHSYDFFKKNSINYLSYNIIGSLKLATYNEHKVSSKVSYDIVFISTYRYVYDKLDFTNYSRKEKITYYPIFSILKSQLNQEKEIIRKLAELNLFKMSILLANSEKSELEKNSEIFFYSSLKNKVDLQPKSDLSSYCFSNSANLVITTNSALGFEMIGLGKKVLFLLKSNEMILYNKKIGLHEDYFDKLPNFLTTTTNFEEFFNKIKYLNSLSNKDYLLKTISVREEFCVNPEKTRMNFLKALNIYNDN